MITFISFLLFAANGNAVDKPYTDKFTCRTLNPVLGGGFLPNCSSRWQRSRKDQIVFDVDFSTDEFGRRITPKSTENLKHHTGNTLFFGCSFVLGAGVNGNQTMPYYYSEVSPTANVYNYGGSGFGPQQMLAALSNFDVRSQVDPSPSQNLGIYVFLGFHVQRAVGKPSVVNSFGKYFPYYDLDNDGNLIFKGTFETGRPILYEIESWISQIPFIGNLFENLSEAATEHDILITARIIEESFKKFHEKLGSGDFYVLFYPGSDSRIDEKIKIHLEKAHIAYFDYSKLVDMSAPDARVADGHPAAWVHKKVAQQLSLDLHKK